MNKSGIESVFAGTVMLIDLEKVSCAVLKLGYNIQSFYDLENSWYDLNNQHPKQKNKWFSIDRKERQTYNK